MAATLNLSGNRSGMPKKIVWWNALADLNYRRIYPLV